MSAWAALATGMAFNPASSTCTFALRATEGYELLKEPHIAALPLHVLSTAAYSVKTVLQSIQSLLSDPNVDSPLNAHAAKLWGVSEAEYRQVCKGWRRRLRTLLVGFCCLGCL